MRFQRGFTLFEVLVMLTLVSSIVVFLSDVLSKTLDMRGRLGEMTEQAHESQILVTWLQHSLGNLIEGEEKFEGTPKEIKGESLVTLTGEPGVPHHFEWKMDHDGKEDITTLYYTSNDPENPLKVFSWRGSEGGFKFLDEKNESHDKWPPELGDQSSPFPKAILITGQTAPRVGKGQPWSFEIPVALSESKGETEQKGILQGGNSQSASGGNNSGNAGNSNGGAGQGSSGPGLGQGNGGAAQGQGSGGAGQGDGDGDGDGDGARKPEPKDVLRELLKGQDSNDDD